MVLRIFITYPLLSYTDPSGILTLPPPASLTSVAVIPPGAVPQTIMSPTATTTLTRSGGTPLVSAQLTPGSDMYTWPPLHLTNSSVLPRHPLVDPPQVGGLILSPAADPIPQRLVHRIQSGQFVEMRDLLSDNISLHQRCEAVYGMMPLSLLPTGGLDSARYLPYHLGYIVLMLIWQ